MSEYVPNPSNLDLLNKVWDNIKVYFSAQWKDVWGSFGEVTAAIQENTLTKFFAWLQDLDDPLWRDTFNYLIGEKLITENQKNFINSLKDLPPPLNFWAWSLFISSFFTQYMLKIGSQNMETAKQRIAEQNLTELAPVEALVRAGFIAPERMWDIEKQLKKHGFGTEAQDYLFLSQYRLYDVGEIMALWLRGVLTNDKMYERMRELGFTDTRTAELVHLYEVIPGPSDLFQLVAKEAFEPDQIKKFGLDEEFPEAQMEWLEKQGVTRYWAERYWAAHWTNPSPQQVWEMLHRGLVTTEDMDQYFRVIELPRFWRERMTKISYAPYTRVDLRRLWKEGIITDVEEIFKEYKWQGYDEEHALNLTKFAIADAEEEGRQLSLSQIMSAFKDRLLNRADCKYLLRALGYDEAKADFIIENAEYEMEEKETALKIKIIKEKYIRRQLDKFGATADLSRLNLPATYIQTLLTDWEYDFIKTEKLPTKAELQKWWKQGIIKNDEFVTSLQNLGYTELSSNRFLESMQKDAIPVGKAKPSKKELDDMLSFQIINQEDYKNELSEIGYTDRYIAMFIELIKKKGTQ